MPDVAGLAALHAACFTNPRPWSEPELASLLDMPGTFLTLAPGGFAMGRVVLDEVELLTIAVDPQQRRQGIGARLLADFETEARDRGAIIGFLEVAADNPAAIALYAGAGWVQTGLRRRYYRDTAGPAVDAILMSRNFAPSMA